MAAVTKNSKDKKTLGVNDFNDNATVRHMGKEQCDKIPDDDIMDVLKKISDMKLLPQQHAVSTMGSY